MLSNQTPDTLPGRYQRQNSTPTVINSQNTASFHAPTPQRQHEAHRRGLSLDQALGTTLKEQPSLQDDIAGFEELLRQQIEQQTLRETQQQQQKARPGQEQQHELTQHTSFIHCTQPTPRQAPGLGYTLDEHLPTNTTGLDTNTYSLDDNLTTNTLDFFRTFDSNASAGYLESFGTGPDGQNGILQTNEIMNSPQVTHGLPLHEGEQGSSNHNTPERPQTPINQKNKNFFPLTPDTTPFSRKANGFQFSQSRTVESSPIRGDPNETIKASHAMQRGSSYQDNFAAMRQHATSADIPSPPHTAPLHPRWSCDIAPFPQPDNFNLSSLKMDIPAGSGGYNPANYSPMTNALPSAMSSFQSSPEVTHMPLFGEVGAGGDGGLIAATMTHLPSSQSASRLSSPSSPTKQDPHSRTQSMSDVDLEECVVDTGVTVDEIASFIFGPMPDDGKWKCLFENCGLRFGRKENIKSHVQNHLGDRGFRCPNCDKDFVRPHDLKRHIKIHTDNKPHKCPCGREFHRQDALTRHRQRGVCVGAFDGPPKKPIKRGRPKKSRPNTEERLEKAARTRKSVMERTIPGSTYASSISGSSEYSHDSPPEIFDHMSPPAASSPSLSHRAFQDASFISPALLANTPPTSPIQSTRHSGSPQHSQRSRTPKAASQSPSPQITSIAEEQLNFLIGHSHSGSRKSSAGYHSSLPELDISSSSPATSKYFDFDSKPEVNAGGPSMADDMFTQDFVLMNEIGKDTDSAMFDPFLDDTPDMGGFKDNSFQQEDYSSFNSNIGVAPSDVFADSDDFFAGV